MNIALAAEPVLHIFGLAITNSILTAWVILAMLLVGALILRRFLNQVPGKIQSVLEMVYTYFYDSAESIMGNPEATRVVFPFIITLFFFIWLSNWSGLLPGFGSIGVKEVIEGKEVLVPLFRAPTSDLNMVASLAFLTVAFIQYLGLRFAGPKIYISKFINLKGPIDFYIGLIELISEVTRLLSFTFRLFGNVFAGEVLITVMLYLTSTLVPFLPFVPIPFFMLEMMVGVVQAFIFCFLTIVFAALAVSGHSQEHEHHIADDAKVIAQNMPHLEANG